MCTVCVYGIPHLIEKNVIIEAVVINILISTMDQMTVLHERDHS